MRTLCQKSMFLVLLLFCSAETISSKEDSTEGIKSTTTGEMQPDTIPEFSPTLLGVDDSTCSMTFLLDQEYDFVPVLKCEFSHPGVATYALPLFADIDGDGETEIVATLEHSPDGFAIINPNNCETEFIVNVGGDIKLKDGGPVLGDVDTDGYVDLFIEVDTKIQRWEFDPSQQDIVKVWETAGGIAPAKRSHLDIWDLNQDGIPEIIPNQGHMVNSVTGYVYPDKLPLLHEEGKGLFAFTADADLGEAPEGQGNVELVYGTHLFRYDFLNEEWVLVRNVPEINWGFVANVSLADMDLDGDVDAVMSNWDATGQALIWDLQTEELLGGGIFDYPGDYGSRINVSDMDNDPYPEMVMTSVQKIFAIDDIVTTGGFQTITWLDETSDESGHTQITSFDFDGNGKYEIAYRDETKLRIFSGMGTGQPSNGYPSTPRVLMDTGDHTCESFTGMEYPTIGDIDNDGEAEIVSGCRTAIRIYESGSLPWGNASKVWNTQAFNVTCVNQDGTIPAVPLENYKIYNNFLAQVNLNPTNDTLVVSVPDASVSLTNVRNDCTGNMAVDIEVCNGGASILEANTPIALYWKNPTVEQAYLLDTFRTSSELQVGECLIIEGNFFEAPADEVHLFAVVNDDGQTILPYILESVPNGGSFPITAIDECSYINNMADSLVVTGQNVAVEVEATICHGETWTTDGFTFSESGSHTFTLTSSNGCDSTVTLMLEVLPEIESTVTAEICEGATYTFNDQSYSETGTYLANLTAANGCDSLVSLELQVLSPTTTTLEATICEGASYPFGGNQYEQSGTYHQMLTAANGCDSMVSLELQVLATTESFIQGTICEGEAYDFFGASLSEGGVYTQVLPNSNGCDSTITLELDILSPTYSSQSASICEGESYPFADAQYSEAGVYTQVYTGANGCDSVATLNLEVLTPSNYSFETSICEGESFDYNGQSFAEAGTYTQHFTAANGCDSTVQFAVELLPTIENFLVADICEGESYTLADQAYASSGVYTEVFTAANGCDSTVHVDLTVLAPVNEHFSAQICDGESFEIGGNYYNQSGTYNLAYTAQNGCDSMVTFQLEVMPEVSTFLDKKICRGDSMLFHGTYLSEAGLYTQTLSNDQGCDSTVTLSLKLLTPVEKYVAATICEGESYTWDGATYQEAGQYQSTYTGSNGCDSTIYFALEVLSMPNTILDVEICEGETYEMAGTDYNSTGIYQKVLTAENGCDSLVNLDLTVLQSVEHEITADLCAGEVYEFAGDEYFGAGTHTATFTAANGCDSTVTLNLNVYESVQVQEAYTICEGDSVLVNGNYVSSAGLYTAQYQTVNGCDSLVEVQVQVLTSPEIWVEDAEICTGEHVQLEAFGGNQYQWYPADGLSCIDCPNPIASPAQTTTYTVTSAGCMDAVVSTQITVQVHELPEVEAGEDRSITYGQPLALTAPPATNDLYISWETPNEVICDDCPNEVEVMPEESVEFRLTVINEWGCEGTDELFVEVRTECIEKDFFIPNIISPNGDGSNDYFYVEPQIQSNLRYLRIYDRWGELIFSSTDFGDKWDGRFRGQALDPGVYVYYMEAICPNSRPFTKVGNITVLK